MSHYMQMALELAKRGTGLVSPNPLVGCVIVKNDQIIGQGWHKGPGRPHAEIEALQQTGDAAADADVYVNLEPCSHFGRTPPCVDALIKAKVKAVHIPFLDPNPLVNGQGITKLQNAGIAVYVGEAGDAARKLNEFFLHYIVHKTPFVVAKWAMTLDGKIAMRNRHSKWITDIEARTNAHQLRQSVDAILVGVGTVLADDPMLTLHLLESSFKIPLRIVIDPSGKTPLTCNLLQHHPDKTLLVTTEQSTKQWQNQVIALGARVWVFAQIDLPLLLQKLGEVEVTSVLVEGGSKTLGAFFNANLVNKVYTYVAPKLFNDEQAISALRVGTVLEPLPFLYFDQVQTLGQDLLIISYPKEAD